MKVGTIGIISTLHAAGYSARFTSCQLAQDTSERQVVGIQRTCTENYARPQNKSSENIGGEIARALYSSGKLILVISVAEFFCVRPLIRDIPPARRQAEATQDKLPTGRLNYVRRRTQASFECSGPGSRFGMILSRESRVTYDM